MSDNRNAANNSIVHEQVEKHPLQPLDGCRFGPKSLLNAVQSEFVIVWNI